MTVQFAPKECETFSINSVTIPDLVIKDYQDSYTDFFDPKDSVNPAGTCGTRTVKLLNAADDSDLAVSWITLTLYNAATGEYHIDFTPRGAKGTSVNVKVKITSVDYPSVTWTSPTPFSFTVNSDCDLVELKKPVSPPNSVADVNYVIHAGAT